MSILPRVALLGLATGSRSASSLAALALSTDRSGSSIWTNPWTVGLATTAGVGELVGDKLPQTPSRLQPQGFVPRLALGAGTAAILAHREGNSRSTVIIATAIGLAGAGAGSWLGAQWRTLAADKLGKDLPGALIEDAACLAAVRYAVIAA